MGPAGSGLSPSCSSGAFSVPLPFPALAVDCFSPFPISASRPLLSPVLSFCLLEGAPKRERPGSELQPRGHLPSPPLHLLPALLPHSGHSPLVLCPRTASTLMGGGGQWLQAWLLPQLLQPLCPPGGWPWGLGRGEAAEPGHVSWPHAEPLPWPQSHPGQAQLCPLKSLETQAAVDSPLPPG